MAKSVSIFVVVVVSLTQNDRLLDLLLVVVAIVDGILVVDANAAAMPTRKGIGLMAIGGMTIRMSILTMVGDVVILMYVAR